MKLAWMLLLLVSCSAPVATQESTTTISSMPPTTSIPATTRTTTLRAATEVWYEGYLFDALEAYNTQFANDFETHMSDLEFEEARLDCVEADAIAADWRASVPEAPDPQLEVLSDELFDQIEEAIAACTEAEVLGDFNDVARDLASAHSTFDRIGERVTEIYAEIS